MGTFHLSSYCYITLEALNLSSPPIFVHACVSSTNPSLSVRSPFLLFSKCGIYAMLYLLSLINYKLVFRFPLALSYG
jgi:hypothetical protein